MEPYRAYVSDRLDTRQRPLGFLMQSGFTGLAQTLAYLTPTLLVLMGLNKDSVSATNIPHSTMTAFLIGALFSFTTVWWSVRKVPELALSSQELVEMRARPTSMAATLRDIFVAVREMPQTMRRLWWMTLFQSYGMMCYWIYIVLAIAHSHRRPVRQSKRSGATVSQFHGGFETP